MELIVPVMVLSLEGWSEDEREVSPVSRGPDSDAVLDRSRGQPAPRLRDAPSGGSQGSAGGLSARIVPDRVLLPGGGGRAVRSGRADSRADDRGTGQSREGSGHGGGGLDLREARGGRLSQHADCPRRRWHAPRPLPQDAHTR